MNKAKLILEWDESNIVDSEVEHRLENKEDFDLIDEDEDDVRQLVYEDSDIFTIRWDDMVEQLSEIMQGLTKRNYHKDKWSASVEGFGWRNSGGEKTFTAETGQELLREILPKTDCTFRIFKDGRNRIKIQNFHHDSPTGNEWYYIKPMTLKEVEADERY